MAETFSRPLLDRLLREADGGYPSATVDARGYADAIRRDVEALLNARAPRDADSVIGYGLPDFSHLSPDSPDDQWRLAAAIRETLERFETRLTNVRVEVAPGGGGARGAFAVTAEAREGHMTFSFKGRL